MGKMWFICCLEIWRETGKQEGFKYSISSPLEL